MHSQVEGQAGINPDRVVEGAQLRQLGLEPTLEPRRDPGRAGPRRVRHNLPEQLLELSGFFTGNWPAGHPFSRITAAASVGKLRLGAA